MAPLLETLACLGGSQVAQGSLPPVRQESLRLEIRTLQAMAWQVACSSSLACLPLLSWPLPLLATRVEAQLEWRLPIETSQVSATQAGAQQACLLLACLSQRTLTANLAEAQLVCLQPFCPSFQASVCQAVDQQECLLQLPWRTSADLPTNRLAFSE